MTGQKCDHIPQEGTTYTAAERLPAALNRSEDYPIDAVCATCSLPVRCVRPGAPWQLKRLVAFKARHPEVSASENGRATWFDDDGPHAVTYETAYRMLDYLEALFDRWC